MCSTVELILDNKKSRKCSFFCEYKNMYIILWAFACTNVSYVCSTAETFRIHSKSTLDFL